MKKNNNITKKLKKEFQFIIRNSENLEEKTAFRFNYWKLIFLAFSFVISSIIISTILVRKILGKWLDPAHIETVNKQKLKKLNNTIDTLESKIKIQTEFIDLLQKSIKSHHIENLDEELIKLEEINKKKKKISDLKNNINNEDKNNKIINRESNYEDIYPGANKEFELKNNQQINSLRGISFFPPVNGIITSHLDLIIEHYGVDIVAKKNEPIKSIADGIVIFSDWTVEGGNVIIIQHKKNLLSIYKHNSQLLKKIGNFVRKGDAIAIIGNSGELSTGPHLHFEMWHRGTPVNPLEYIVF